MRYPVAPVVGIVVFVARTAAAEPNLLADASQSFVSAVAANTFDVSQCFREPRGRILIRGSAAVHGEVTIQFIPCEQTAEVLVVLEGFVCPRTVAELGPIQMHNAGR